jgi:ribonuclease J
MTNGDELVFLPLGGAGEIGMNLNLYGYGVPGQRRWLMIDLGIGFESQTAGVDIITPDPGFIVERRDRLEALILTHAHEDHLGAVPYLWPQLRCPIYASAFTAEVLRAKLEGLSWGREVDIRRLSPSVELQLGPFSLSFIGMTHSIPEAVAVAIRTPAGVVLHTGDWKLDPHPVVGPVSDEASIARLGDAGLLALICDSTNVFEPGTSGSEGMLYEPLRQIIRSCEQQVVVTCFATNVARLHTIAQVAQQCGRSVAITGRSLQRTYRAAQECGYFSGYPPFLDDAAAAGLPRHRLLVISTGCQGEPNAALGRLARGEHPKLSLQPDDTVIFSSREIPGNEAAIGQLHNLLLRRGVRVVGSHEAEVHVSGHPARDELAQMYRLARPRIAVPVHGEFRHLQEHARFARAAGVGQVVVAENGSLVRLSPGEASVVGKENSGRFFVEGNRLVPYGSDVFRTRAKAAHQGLALITVALDGQAVLAEDVQVSAVGLLQPSEAGALDIVRQGVATALGRLSAQRFGNDDAVEEVVRLAVRQTFRHLLDKRPITHVHIVRLNS